MERLQAPENLGEFPKLPIYYLPERLGFNETPELFSMRKQAIAAYKVNDLESRGLLGEYSDQASAVVDTLPAELQNSARIGMNIAEATIRRDAGSPQEYIVDLEGALTDLAELVYAGQDQLKIIQTIVQEAIDEEQENLARRFV